LWLFVIKFEINEELIILHTSEGKEVHIVFLLQVNLTVAELSNDTLVETTGSNSIVHCQVCHIVKGEFANSRLCLTDDILCPRLVEQKLLNTKNSPFCVNSVYVLFEGHKLVAFLITLSPISISMFFMT
jgi:hypothetical protein